VTHLVWRGTHTGDYGAVAATGARVEIRDITIWRFAESTVIEISTVQDQFALPGIGPVGLLSPRRVGTIACRVSALPWQRALARVVSRWSGTGRWRWR